MTNSIRSFMLVLLGMGLGLFASSKPLFAASPISLSIALPAQAIDTSDLDIRDEQNRPIRSPQARRSFEQLWARSLNLAILNSLTPIRLQLLALFNSSWDKFAGVLRGAARSAVQTLQAWLQEKKKQRIIWRVAFEQVQMQTHSTPLFFVTDNPFLSYLSSVISSTRLLR